MSDHISGPRALAEPIADITDVYAFPSPERQGHLVLVQNTLPFAPALGAVLGRARLPLPVAAAHAGSPERSCAVRRRRGRVRVRLRVFRSRRGRRRARTGRRVHDAGGRHGHLSGERRAGRFRSWRSCVCRPALGSVHHGRSGGAEDDRDRQARVHRSGRDLHGRQERPQPRRRVRLCAAPRTVWSWSGWSRRR